MECKPTSKLRWTKIEASPQCPERSEWGQIPVRGSNRTRIESIWPNTGFRIACRETANHRHNLEVMHTRWFSSWNYRGADGLRLHATRRLSRANPTSECLVARKPQTTPKRFLFPFSSFHHPSASIHFDVRKDVINCISSSSFFFFNQPGESLFFFIFRFFFWKGKL